MFTISFCFRVEIHCCTGFLLLLLPLTYDNLNLLGKSKKFELWRAQVIATLKKVTLKKENEQMGSGRTASIMHTSLHGHDTVFKLD